MGSIAFGRVKAVGQHPTPFGPDRGAPGATDMCRLRSIALALATLPFLW